MENLLHKIVLFILFALFHGNCNVNGLRNILICTTEKIVDQTDQKPTDFDYFFYCGKAEANEMINELYGLLITVSYFFNFF